MEVINQSTGKVIAKNVELADTAFTRMLGLMFKDSIGANRDGLLFTPSNSIHTFFMKFDIDVIFLNSKNEVIKVFEKLPPWRVTRIYFSARKVIELEGGTLNGGVSQGHKIEVKSV